MQSSVVVKTIILIFFSYASMRRNVKIRYYTNHWYLWYSKSYSEQQEKCPKIKNNFFCSNDPSRIKWLFFFLLHSRFTSSPCYCDENGRRQNIVSRRNEIEIGLENVLTSNILFALNGFERKYLCRNTVKKRLNELKEIPKYLNEMFTPYV